MSDRLGVAAFAQADLTVVALPEAEQEDLLIVAADGAGAELVRGAAVGVESSLLGARSTSPGAPS